jgi:hypothetical protein
MDREARVATVLFREYETVFRATAQVLMPLFRTGNIPETELLIFPFADLMEGLATVDNSVPRDIMQNATSVLLGTRDYRSPESLGLVRYQFCYVVILARQGSGDAARHFGKVPLETVGDLRLWIWSTQVEGRKTTFYAMTAGGYLLVASDPKHLERVWRQLAGERTGQTAPWKLGEWKAMRGSALWAYRRYQRGEHVDKQAAGLELVPEWIETLVLLRNTGSKATLRLVATPAYKGPETIRITKDLPAFQRRASGLWEAVVPLLTGTEEEVSAKLFAIMFLLGFGAYL